MYLLTNVIQLPRSECTNCACVIKFHLEKWCPIRDEIFVVVETVLFHSI